MRVQKRVSREHISSGLTNTHAVCILHVNTTHKAALGGTNFLITWDSLRSSTCQHCLPIQAMKWHRRVPEAALSLPCVLEKKTTSPYSITNVDTFTPLTALVLGLSSGRIWKRSPRMFQQWRLDTYNKSLFWSSFKLRSRFLHIFNEMLQFHWPLQKSISAWII